MAVLFNVQYLAFGYHSGSLQAGIEHASALRRVSSLLIAGAFGGVAWFLLRRYTKGEHSEIDESIWNGDGQLSLRRCMGTSLISEVVIGMGASIGREAAPKLLGGASASVLACSGIATLTAWIYLPTHATYLDIPQYRLTGSVMVWAVLAGPVIGLVSSGYIRLIGWVSHHRATGLEALFAPVLAFGILGVTGIRYPELFGNSKDMAHDAFVGAGSLGLLFILFALKPLVTAMCLGSGASGGLFTPP